MWKTPVPTTYESDRRFHPFLKTLAGRISWRRMAIKAAMRRMFEDLEACRRAGDVDSLLALVEGETSHLALDACRLGVPDWAVEFVDRYNEAVRIMVAEPMPRFEIKPAVRNIQNIIIGLAGPPGGGKTCSALRLATGIAKGAPIVLLDTEYGRPTEFAPVEGAVAPAVFEPTQPTFTFQTITLDPPYTPDRYRLAAHAASKAKPAVLIIDNMTDEHHAQLDMAHAGALKAHGANWIEPRGQHRRLMAKLRQHPWYVIMCIRAREARIDGEQVHKGDWLIQCDNSLASECLLFQLVTRGGVPSGTGESPWKLPGHLRRLFPLDRPLDEAAGSALAQWARPQGNWDNSDA